MAFMDLTGQRFGLLVVEAREGSINRQAAWRCKCDCGGTTVVRGYSLRTGETTSCRCVEKARQAAGNPVHGQASRAGNTTEYKAWETAKSRCKPQHRQAKDYFHRGIRMAPEWENDFQAFFEHIGPKWDPSLTLDRIDNDRGYEPGNVRWATRAQQEANKRK